MKKTKIIMISLLASALLFTVGCRGKDTLVNILNRSYTVITEVRMASNMLNDILTNAETMEELVERVQDTVIPYLSAVIKSADGLERAMNILANYLKIELQADSILFKAEDAELLAATPFPNLIILSIATENLDNILDEVELK